MVDTRYKRVKLFMDLFFVNKLVFLHTKSDNINYISVQSLNSMNTTEILQGINIVHEVLKCSVGIPITSSIELTSSTK